VKSIVIQVQGAKTWEWSSIKGVKPVHGQTENSNSTQRLYQVNVLDSIVCCFVIPRSSL
jgi:hypothetical protein